MLFESESSSDFAMVGVGVVVIVGEMDVSVRFIVVVFFSAFRDADDA